MWINDAGHLTPFHSDTNGLYVFNVQVAGAKRWQLLDPDAPLALSSRPTCGNAAWRRAR